MSSSVDAGYHADQASEEYGKGCSKSPTGLHEWEKHGTWPSIWEECKYCHKKIYWK